MESLSKQLSAGIHEIRLSSRSLIWKILIILAVLGLTVLIAATIGKVDSKVGLLAAGVPLAILGLVTLLKFLDYAPVIILFVAGYVPFGLDTGTESKVMASLIITAVLIMVWILRMIGVEKKISIAPSPINRPLLGFVIVTLIALVWSNVFRDPVVRLTRTFPFVQMASTLVMISLPLSLLMVGNLVRNVKILRWMVGLVLLTGAIDLVGQFLHLNLPVNAGGITSMWVVALSVSMVLFDRSLSRLKQVFLLTLATGSIYWSFGLNLSWLAGWLPSFIALGLICLIKSKKLFFALAVGLGIFYIINTSYFVKDIQAEAAGSGDTRVAAWANNWRVTGQHFLFGTGPAGYAAYYMTYFPGDAMATHSNYIDILAETGITGFALYIWLFGSIAWLGYRLLRSMRGRGDFIEALVIALFAGTCGCIVIMGFGDWLIPFAYTQTIAGFNYEVCSWLFMGALAAVDGMVKTGILSVSRNNFA